MTTLTDTVADIQEQVLEAIKTAQTPVIDTVRTVAGMIEGFLPEDRPEIPFADQLVSPDEVIELWFDFAEKLLANQHDFTVALVDAVRPLLPNAAPATPTAAKPKAA